MLVVGPVMAAWARWRIRRLYNRSNWVEAHDLAKRYIHSKINREFAQDIVIRCLWNQEQWNDVIDFSERFPSLEHEKLAKRAMKKIAMRSGLERESSPRKFHHLDWNDQNLLDNWYQEDNVVWIRHPWGWTHWVMPDDFVLSDVHPSLLSLATNVLLKPWVPEATKIETQERKFGSKLALAFSGGVDSTAAAMLLPDDTILAYHERSFASLLSHDLPLRLFEQIEERWNRNVIMIPSNHEKIRTIHGKQVGFSTDYAAGVHLILMADYLDLSGIAFGTPIDNTWLQKGRKYRDFNSTWHWKYWSEEFAKAGLHLVIPINHISEAGALRICQQSDLIDEINSCLRGDDGQYCGQCWKCFHKNGPLGREINPQSKEIQILLNKMPLRTAHHALWAIQKMKLEHLVPHLSDELISPLEWWENAYRPGLDLIQQPWRETVQERTEKWLPYMQDDKKLHCINLFPEYPV